MYKRLGKLSINFNVFDQYLYSIIYRKLTEKLKINDNKYILCFIVSFFFENLKI